MSIENYCFFLKKTALTVFNKAYLPETYQYKKDFQDFRDENRLAALSTF